MAGTVSGARRTRAQLDRAQRQRAGCVSLAYSRATGALRGVYRAEDQGFDPDSGKWAVVCEDHGTILQVDTRAHAMASDTADFCDECRA